MSIGIVTLGISSERDMVAVRQRAREISDALGFGSQDQVRIATAVSELARTVLSSATGGKVEFSISGLGRDAWLHIRIQSGADRRSEADPRALQAASARDDAFTSAGRLMDSCEIAVAEAGSERLHDIRLGKALPPSQVVDAAVLLALSERLAASPVVSTFSEVTLQNKELLDTLAELRIKQDALLALTEELARTNRAVVALNADIEEKSSLLRQADIHKDEFIATLAHELRNPLGPIRAAVDLMRRVDPTNTASHGRAQDVISRQVDQLARLVDDLLDVARISKGKITLQRAPIDIAGCMAMAVETIQPFIDSRGHTLEIALPDQPLQVLGDPVRLAQVIGNLLNNAAKYTVRGGCIGLAARRIGTAAVQITVRDNGIGLSAERRQSIFGMFSQGAAAPDRAQDGLGIGLSLVRQLVTLHDGLVWVDSDGEGHGSCFVIELPLLVAAAPTPSPASATGDSVPGEPAVAPAGASRSTA